MGWKSTTGRTRGAHPTSCCWNICSGGIRVGLVLWKSPEGTQRGCCGPSPCPSLHKPAPITPNHSLLQALQPISGGIEANDRRAEHFLFLISSEIATFPTHPLRSCSWIVTQAKQALYLLAVCYNLPLRCLYRITSFSPFFKGKLSSLFSLFSGGKFHISFSIPVPFLWILPRFGAGFLWNLGVLGDQCRVPYSKCERIIDLHY